MGRRAAGRVMNLSALSSMERIQLLWRLPSVTRLSLNLMRDPRVPLRNKLTALAVVAFVLSPYDIPRWVPVLGQAAGAMVLVNVLDVFIKSAPREVVREHIVRLGLDGKYRV